MIRTYTRHSTQNARPVRVHNHAKTGKIPLAIRNGIAENEPNNHPCRFITSVLGGIFERGSEADSGGTHEGPLPRRDGKRQRVLYAGLEVGPGKNGRDQGVS